MKKTEIKTNKQPEEVSFSVIFAGLVLILFALIHMKLGVRYCVEVKEVQSIGSCGLFADCRVTFTDGSRGDVSSPSKGDMYCMKREWHMPKDKKDINRNMYRSVTSYLAGDRMDKDDILNYFKGLERVQK